MSFDTLLIVLAIAVGPAAAVAGGIVYARFDRIYQRRLGIFHTLMRMRRHWLTQDWIGSLNLVPVEFSHSDRVIAAFEALMDKYADPSWKGQEDERRRAVLDTESAACELLLAMAAALKIELKGPDLRTRPNTPYGWIADDIQERQARDTALQVLQGQRTLRVELAPSSALRAVEDIKELRRAPQ